MARCRDKNVSLHAERPYAFPPVRRTSPLPPVVVGMGPSGLFAALFLARNGVILIVLERGRPVEERTADVERFWATGVLGHHLQCSSARGRAPSPTAADHRHPRSSHPTVFRALVEAAPGGHPLLAQAPHRHRHSGTWCAMCGGAAGPGVRRALRAPAGGPDVRDGALRAVAVDGPGGQYDLLLRRAGVSRHSARDTFQMLLDAGVPMAPKPFAIGVRIEHAQAALSEAQFGPAGARLPAADYKLACHLPTGAAARLHPAPVPAGRWWPPPRRRGGW